MVYFISFLLGCLTFIVSQLFFRLPLMQAFLMSATGMAWFMAQPVFAPALLGFTAGLVEEPARWLALKFYTVKKTNKVLAAALLGFGHGLVEALWLYFTTMYGCAFADIVPGLIERFIAIVIHIALSIFLFHGLEDKKSKIVLPAAILIHGLINFLIPFIQNRFGINGLLIYLVIVAMVAILYISYHMDDGQLSKEITIYER